MAKAMKRILPKHKEEERVGDEAAQAKEEEAPIHGDVLEAMILTRLTLLDLVAASLVSKVWQCSVSTSLRISPRVRPWFIVYALHHRNHSLTSAFAFDPSSHVWLRIQNTHNFHFTTTTTGALRSSDSQNLLYTLSTTGFSFSSDPFHLTWHHVKPPLVWRENPIVARLGSRLLVAGGTCDFVDDPLAVEMYDIASGKWDTCQPMPFLLKDSATSTWISTAAADNKVYLLEKRSRLICSFDAETKTWGPTFNLNLISNPNNINPPVSVFHSTIGFIDNRLVLVGLMGETEDLHGLGLWEIDQNTYECRPIGEMPSEMVKRLRNANSPLSTMSTSMEGGSIYIYDPRNPEKIFLCELNEGICEWGYSVNPMVKDRKSMERFVFTSSRVRMGDLRNALSTGNRTFTVESDGDGLSSPHSFTVPRLS